MYKFKYQNDKRKTIALNEIYSDMIENLGKEEIKRYVETFPKEKDFNIAMYGNLLVYYSQVREFLVNCGFTKYNEKRTTKLHDSEYKISDQEVWKYYLCLVGIVASYIVKSPNWIKFEIIEEIKEEE